MSNVVEPISIYLLNMTQEQHTPQKSSQAVYCNIKYSHLILRGFSSAPEHNSHSQAVIYCCSKETDRATTTERIFLSKSGSHSYCICNEYKKHVISASASACLCVCERLSDSIPHTENTSFTLMRKTKSLS